MRIEPVTMLVSTRVSSGNAQSSRCTWRSSSRLPRSFWLRRRMRPGRYEAISTERMNRSSLFVGICRLPMRFKIVPPLTYDRISFTERDCQKSWQSPPSFCKKSVLLCLLGCDEVLEFFFLALELSKRNLACRCSRLHSCHLLLTLLHEAVAKDASHSTYCEADPKVGFLEHRIHPPFRF